MDRFNVACIIFSFITGMFVAHEIESGRGCVIKFTQGKETHVHIGRTVND
jgi:hypothetical protein